MPGAEPSRPGPARLFVALWPGPEVAQALQAWGRRWPGTAAAQPVAAQRLHLTLHFLGDVPRERLHGLTAALWPGGIAVLEPERMPAPLVRLHAAIGETLQRLSLPTEARSFRPHVTLARRAGMAAAPASGPAVRWPVRGFVLVESQPPADGGYRIVQRYR